MSGFATKRLFPISFSFLKNYSGCHKYVAFVIFKYIARPLLVSNPENATIEELKQVCRVGSIETATRCTAIQMLLAGANRDLVCNALLITNRAIRNWINWFADESGFEGDPRPRKRWDKN